MKYIKTNRIFTSLRNWDWLFTILVALGGLFIPKLGLLVIFIMLGLTATSLFKGRYWCGNVCPHGSLFDKLILPLSRNVKIPNFLGSKTFGLGFFGFFLFNFSRKLLAVLKTWGSFDFLDKLGLVFVTTYLMVMTLGAILGLIFSPRTWCQFCPMASIQKATASLARKTEISKSTEDILSLKDLDKCLKCGKCSRVCPIQIRPHENFDSIGQFTDPNCIKCSTCIHNCPLDLLEWKKLQS